MENLVKGSQMLLLSFASYRLKDVKVYICLLTGFRFLHPLTYTVDESRNEGTESARLVLCSTFVTAQRDCPKNARHQPKGSRIDPGKGRG